MFIKKSNDFSIIDTGLTIEGDVCCKGKLIVKGTLKGKLKGETVIIAKNGAVYAEMTAADISIGGVFEGTLRSTQKLVILSSGNCSGCVNCQILVLESGGILNADVNCLPEAGTEKKDHDTAKTD